MYPDAKQTIKNTKPFILKHTAIISSLAPLFAKWVANIPSKNDTEKKLRKQTIRVKNIF